MVRLIISCLWICVVTLASTYAVIAFKTHRAEAAIPTAEKIGYEKTRPINVPMIANGAVQGYVVVEFSYTSTADEEKKANVPIEAYLLDEAFKTLYADEKLDFSHLEKYDIASMTKMLVDRVNTRLKSPLLKDVLVEQFSYISREEITK